MKTLYNKMLTELRMNPDDYNYLEARNNQKLLEENFFNSEIDIKEIEKQAKKACEDYYNERKLQSGL